MQQQDNLSSPRRRHFGRWIVAMIAILEIVVAAGIFFWVRGPGSCAAITPQAIEGVFGGVFGRAGAGGDGSSGAGNGQGAQQPTSSNNSSAGDAGAGGSGSGAASGDLKQLPDPNCVGKTAAGLLNSDQATAPPSCAPMSPSPELQRAAKQVQNAGSAGSSGPGSASPTATP